MAQLFQATEREYGPMPAETVQRMTKLSRLRARKVIQALRDPSSIPRRRLENEERRAAVGLVRGYTPLRRLVSRHTRELLRRYAREGMLDTAIAERQVEDHFIDMSEAERELYDAVEAYIRTTYNQAAAEKAAVGFVMTTYRRRISNLHYEDTVETDVYRALGSRINLFQRVVGPLHPILARLPGTITNTVLADPRTEAPDRADLREAIERQIDEGGSGGFDIDAVLEEDWTMPERPAPAMTMDDLDRVIGAEDLMPQGTQVRPLGAREYALRAPGMTSGAARDDGPRLLRGAHGERRALVARESAVQCSGEPASAERNDGGAAVGEAARPRLGVGLAPIFPCRRLVFLRSLQTALSSPVKGL